MSKDWASEEAPGYVRSVNDLSLEDARIEINSPERVPDVSYAYELETASMGMAMEIRESAGPRSDYCQP